MDEEGCGAREGGGGDEGEEDGGRGAGQGLDRFMMMTFMASSHLFSIDATMRANSCGSFEVGGVEEEEEEGVGEGPTAAAEDRDRERTQIRIYTTICNRN